ncbi:LBF_2017 N-terminal domain-containing protein [Leptospira sp. 'Mane']|uniref:LBF_2017 N-terminal domain-containing protein n=1 Tax=Leptospira sp. 'Mane' TaxID=3387407 RepID=UPI00398AC64A
MKKISILLLLTTTILYSQTAKKELSILIDAPDDANFELELWKENPGDGDAITKSVPEVIVFRGNKIKVNPKDEFVFFRVRRIGSFGAKGFWTQVYSADVDPGSPLSVPNEFKQPPKVFAKVEEPVIVPPSDTGSFVAVSDKENVILYLTREKLNITTADTMAGTLVTNYKINDGVWQTLPAGEFLSFSDEGDYNLQYYSVDKVGNKEETRSIHFIKDTLAPKTSLVWQDEKQTNGQNSGFFSPETKLSLNAADSGSGTQESYYGVQCVNSGSVSFQKYTSPISLKESFSECKSQYRLLVYSVDKVGNKETTQTFEINYSSLAVANTLEEKKNP